MDAALQEARSEAESEQKSRHEVNLKLKAAQSEIEALNEQIEEESIAKTALQQKLSKALADAASGKGGLGAEDVARIEELEDHKRKLTSRVQEMEEALIAAETKATGSLKLFDNATTLFCAHFYWLKSQ